MMISEGKYMEKNNPAKKVCRYLPLGTVIIKYLTMQLFTVFCSVASILKTGAHKNSAYQQRYN